MIVVHIPSWFPDAEHPLNGNFILRQIGAVAASTDSVLLHHSAADFDCPVPDGVRFHPIHTQAKGLLPFAYLKAFRDILKAYGKPDIVHLHVALPLGPVAAFLSRTFNIPLMVSEHWSVYQPMNRGLLQRRQQRELQYVYDRAAHVTAVSQNLLDNIAATVPAAAKKTKSVVGNVVDTTLFSLKDNLPRNGKKQILHVSTLDNKAKNILGILRATGRLSTQRSDFELNIVHDYRNEEAEQFVKENNLTEFVHFLGRKTSAEIAKLLHQSDFFLLFSNYENQPCVLLEAFSTGTPAITTPVGGIPEIITPENAVTVNPRDETQLTEKLNLMLDTARQYEPARIREQALKICSPKDIGKKWLRVYRQLASRNAF